MPERNLNLNCCGVEKGGGVNKRGHCTVLPGTRAQGLQQGQTWTMAYTPISPYSPTHMTHSNQSQRASLAPRCSSQDCDPDCEDIQAPGTMPPSLLSRTGTCYTADK